MLVQRFQQDNAVKRTIFEMIAQELLIMLPQPQTPADSRHGSVHGGSHQNASNQLGTSPRRYPDQACILSVHAAVNKSALLHVLPA